MAPQIPSSLRGLLRSVEMQTAILRSRGFDIPPPTLAEGYALYLAERTLCPSGRARGSGGYDAKDAAGIRYRVLGRKTGRGTARAGAAGRGPEGGGEISVPGVPRRAFDRLLLIRFDADYHVLFAGMASACDFLQASEYRRRTNEWVLALSDPFWTDRAVWDLTDVFRSAAAQVAREDAPVLEPIATPRSRPPRRAPVVPGATRRRPGRHRFQLDP